MQKTAAYFQLILIGCVFCCSAVESTFAKAKKARNTRSILFENRWPDPDPNIIRFPHQTSCHYYYLVLSDDDIAIQKCPDGELFDYLIHDCDNKESARCWNRHFGNAENQHNHLHKKIKQFRCPYPWGKYPDIHDCSKYYQCLRGNAKHKKCAPYEYFDKIAGKCIAAINAVCADETDVVERGYNCPRSWGLFSFQKDCSKYYECLQGKPVIRTCQQGTLFNDKTRKCLVKEHVACGSRHNPNEKFMSTSVPTQGTTEEETFRRTEEDQSERTNYQVENASSNLKEFSTENHIKSSIFTYALKPETNPVTSSTPVSPMYAYNISENVILKEAT